MKTFVMLLAALLLLLAAFSPAEAGPLGVDTSPCCKKHHPRRIPENRVKGFFKTSSICSLPSVVFMLKNDRMVCADPQETWVWDLMAALEKN